MLFDFLERIWHGFHTIKMYSFIEERFCFCVLEYQVVGRVGIDGECANVLKIDNRRVSTNGRGLEN